MKEYHKIQSIFKRAEKTHKFLVGQWSLPEFEYLANNAWEFTEKVDGTNIRVIWNPEKNEVLFKGKTDNAQMPTFLFERLFQTFIGKLAPIFDFPVCLYGEGYGAKIQKGGGNYIPNGVDFVLFDVLVNDVWLKRDDVENIAGKLGIKSVPVMGRGNIADAIKMVSGGYNSTWGNFQAEGLVIRPQVEMRNRMGHRIISKLKTKDF